MRVDETRTDIAPRGFDDGAGLGAGQVADIPDAFAEQPDVRAHRRRARPVEDLPAADQQIESHGLPPTRRRSIFSR